MDNNRQGAKASYVALVFFLGLWMILPSAVRRFNREAFAEFQAPALHLVGKGRDLARYWELKSRAPEELAAASRDLARINAALELKLHSLDDARKENIRLREMLRYPQSTEFVTVVARVSVRETSSWWQRIIIRKGRSDGVRPGCPVVFGDRVIGRSRKFSSCGIHAAILQQGTPLKTGDRPGPSRQIQMRQLQGRPQR
jgi:rod shape-determining protein MreC